LPAPGIPAQLTHLFVPNTLETTAIGHRMRTDLLKLKVEKRPAHLRFKGRVLLLVDDAEMMRRQLAGANYGLTGELRSRLRDQISTDEITPAYICYYFDETLGEFPYLGLKAGGEFPVTRGSVKKGGFVCSVSGKRRGKGSSREQSPYAELMAGIRVVIAENIERIYNENCQNLGVLTSTDFRLVDRIKAGEEIPLTAFTDGVDEITREIIEYGGLFEYNVARLQGKVLLPRIESQGTASGASATSSDSDSAAARLDSDSGQPGHPMTLSEKIFARHWVIDAAQGEFGVPWVKAGDSGFVLTGHLLRGEAGRGRAGHGPRLHHHVPRPPHLPAPGHAAGAGADGAAEGRGSAQGQAGGVREEAGRDLLRRKARAKARE
jgi:3-isopropylmalate/(R)-2-methylmalate dehydratase large subunit